MTGARRRRPPASRPTILDDLDAGPPPRRRARPGRARRLARRPGGQGGDPRPLRATATTRPGPRRGRSPSATRGLPVKRLLDGRGRAPAAPWRIVPGGTAVRAGAHLGPGVVVMPPSFVNVGAWIGEDTMVDSHVLVGSCAQIGARVHLSAGVTDRRRARAGRRAAGHRRGRRVRRRGLRSLSRACSSGRARSSAPGVILTGTSRLYDLVRGPGARRDRRTRRSSSRAGASSCPGARRSTGRSRGARPVGDDRADRQGPRRRHGRARVALEEALR